MMISDGLGITDRSDQQFFKNHTHETTTFLSPDGKIGIFFSSKNVIIRGEGADIIVGNGGVHINGEFTKRDLIEDKSRSFMTNPTSIVPGNVIPIFIIPSIQHLPNIKNIYPAIGLASKAMNIISAASSLLGG